MGYRIEVRSGADKVIAAGDMSPELQAVLPGFEDEKFPVLRFLDEYGDTYLNSLQVRALRGELDELRALGLGSNALESLQRLYDLTEVSLRTPHQFLVFVGD
ncbi:MAG TPA: hypothetical protein VES42_10555 [Pilimelia sp.]|nr:hypothetical protein [Pilimelia sp.]